jgi:hypothetical protein
MIHLDWALHSYDQRKAKVRRYDEQTRGAGSYFGGHYLLEDVPGAKERFEPLDLPEFRAIARKISKRFRNFCMPGSTPKVFHLRWYINRLRSVLPMSK